MFHVGVMDLWYVGGYPTLTKGFEFRIVPFDALRFKMSVGHHT